MALLQVAMKLALKLWQRNLCHQDQSEFMLCLQSMQFSPALQAGISLRTQLQSIAAAHISKVLNLHLLHGTVCILCMV